MSTRLSSREQYEHLIEKYDTWMFDCDGVLWHGSTIIDGVVDVLKFLRSKGQFVAMSGPYRIQYCWLTSLLNPGRMELFCPPSPQQILSGKEIIFVTNNATTSRKNYKKKFDKLNIEAHVVSHSFGLSAERVS